MSLHVIAAGVPVDVVRYRYPLLEPTDVFASVHVAGLRDLAAMKLGAVARRGIRRDFWDLRAVLEHGARVLRRRGP